MPLQPVFLGAMGAIQYVSVTALSSPPLPDSIYSPVVVSHLAFALRGHPDRQLVAYLLRGFTHGFDLGFRGVFTEPDSRPRNLASARPHRELLDAAIRTEVERGHTAGPFSVPPFSITHCSPIGAVPKPDGSIRVIFDLSSPRGNAVNEHISQEEYSCSYASLDEAVRLVASHGVGAFMGKLDIRHAFRLCPVRRELWPLLCFQWEGGFYVDMVLPFGGRSSPAIFNDFADALAWIFMFFGGIAALIHYLDDYFWVCGSASACQEALDAITTICEFLGVPFSS